MVSATQKARIQKRNHHIAELVAQGKSRAAICDSLKISRQTIDVALRQYPLDTIVLPEPNLVPLVDETDLLESGLAAAKDKLTRTFIKLALSLNEQILDADLPYKKLLYLNKISKLLPNIVTRAKQQAPKNLNLIFNGSNSEDIEKRLLDATMNLVEESDKKE